MLNLVFNRDFASVEYDILQSFEKFDNNIWIPILAIFEKNMLCHKIADQPLKRLEDLGIIEFDEYGTMVRLTDQGFEWFQKNQKPLFEKVA